MGISVRTAETEMATTPYYDYKCTCICIQYNSYLRERQSAPRDGRGGAGGLADHAGT